MSSLTHQLTRVILLALSVLPLTLNANTVVIDFETFPNHTTIPDSTPITTQFPDLTFINTTVITSGISLNEFEFPPYSGVNVAFDDGGPITILFQEPVDMFGGYFTYSVPLLVDGYGSSHQLLSVAASQFSDNEALSGVSGSHPNEFISVSSSSGFSSVTIFGNPGGTSFTLDNATFTFVPEPHSLYLFAIAAFFFSIARSVKSVHIAKWLGVILFAGSTQVLAQQDVGKPEVTPKIVQSGIKTQVTVSSRIEGDVIAGSVFLQQVDKDGKFSMSLGQMTTSGGGIYQLTVPLTVPADQQLFLRVDAAFKGQLKRVTCDANPLYSVNSFLASTDLTPDGLKTYFEKNPIVNTAAKFLERLSTTDFKRDWIMVTNTASTQTGNAASPRFLLQNRNASNVFGIALDDQTVEFLQFVGDKENRFHFHSIETAKSNVISDDQECVRCHFGPPNNAETWPYPRPNWDAYDNWASALPYNRDRIYIDSIEQASFSGLLKTLSGNEIVKQLDLPTGVYRKCNGDVVITPDGTDVATPKTKTVTYTVNSGSVTYPGTQKVDVTQGGMYLTLHATSKPPTSDEGRGVALFDNLSLLNGRRIAQELQDKPDNTTIVDVRPVALAIAKGCKVQANLLQYAPQKALDAFYAYFNIKDFGDLLSDTKLLQHGLPQLKANQEAVNLKGLLTVNGGMADPVAVTGQVARRSVYGKPSQTVNFRVDTITGFMIDREDYGISSTEVALMRLFLQPSKEPVGRWSMGVRGTKTRNSGTYTFADVFLDDYAAAIVSTLGSQPGFMGKDCNALAKLSFATYLNAITNNPGYFSH